MGEALRVALDSGARQYAAIGRGLLAQIVGEGRADPNASYSYGLPNGTTLTTTPLSHALRLFLRAYVEERSLYWPHIVVCRVLDAGAWRLEPAHEGFGPPWSTLLALVVLEGTRLHVCADLAGRAPLRQIRASHWNYMVGALHSVVRATPRGGGATDAYFGRFVAVWRGHILPDVLGDEFPDVGSFCELMRLLLDSLLPCTERALLGALFDAALVRLSAKRRSFDGMVVYVRRLDWLTLGRPNPKSEDPVVRALMPEVALRTFWVGRALGRLPVDLRTHVARLHNRSLLMKEGLAMTRGWALELRLGSMEKALAVLRGFRDSN
jgi:hypothetical protein